MKIVNLWLDHYAFYINNSRLHTFQLYMEIWCSILKEKDINTIGTNQFVVLFEGLNTHRQFAHISKIP